MFVEYSSGENLYVNQSYKLFDDIHISVILKRWRKIIEMVGLVQMYQISQVNILLILSLLLIFYHVN